MIDFNALQKAYENNGYYALQLEVGDVCFQACSYCYMNALEVTQNQLSATEILEILEQSQKLGITAIEWLGGEPLLRKEIFDFLEHAMQLGFRNNMWTGGLPFEDYDVCEKLAGYCKNGLIAFHLSTLQPELYEELHPGRTAKDIKTILSGVEYLLKLGYPASQLLNSVTFTGKQTADDMIETIRFFYENYGIQTSINVYHTYLRPGQSKEDLFSFIPPEKEVAKVYRYYSALMNLDALPLNCVNKQYCSATIAVINTGYVTPCATIRKENADMNIRHRSFYEIATTYWDYLTFQPLRDGSQLDKSCKYCKLHSICWGCRSRSYAAGLGLYGKDPRCFRS